MRVALLALTLAACSTSPMATDAWYAPVDGGPQPDADTRSCERDCVPPPCGLGATTCDPMVSSADWRSFCDGCGFACASAAQTDTCNGDVDFCMGGGLAPAFPVCSASH